MTRLGMMRKHCYVSAVTNLDPTTAEGYWRPLRTLQQEMDDAISRLYALRDVVGVRPRFAYPLIRLAHTGPLTIRDLAESLDMTHSAVSQTLTAMRKEGLVDTVPGPDARTRVVDLTDKGRGLVPFLEAEWRATEEAAEELDAELPFRLADYIAAIRERLTERSFADRIAARLDHPGPSAERSSDWPGDRPGDRQ